MKIPTDGKLLRIFIGEADQVDGRPLFEEIVLLAKKQGLAGATVLKGMMGFGKSSRMHTAKLLRLSEDLPVVVEIVDSEDLGFFEKGKGIAAVREDRTKLNSDISINPSGGLKSKGHPIGATGVGQVVEVFDQLTGKAGARSVKDAKIGLTHNFGATGASCAVHLFQSV